MSTFLSCKYYGVVGGSGGPYDISLFSNAPNLYDGSVGDTSTGYTRGGGSFANKANLAAVYDLGASPPAVTKAELCGLTGGGAAPPLLYYSTTGLAGSWTQLGAALTIASSGSTPSSVTITFTSTTARYWQVWGASISSMTYDDYRLYDGSGNIIGSSGGTGANAPRALIIYH